jgi:hypothetical protein
MPTVRTPAALGDVLAAFKIKLTATDNVLPAAQVRCLLNDDPDDKTPPPVSELFVGLFPKVMTADLGLTAGGGREALTFAGVLKASLWISLPGEGFSWDEGSVLDPDTGALAVFARLLSSLEQFDPVDGDGHGLLSEPLRCTSWYPAPQRLGKPMARLVAEFSMTYQQLLPTVPIPPPPP